MKTSNRNEDDSPQAGKSISTAEYCFHQKENIKQEKGVPYA